ncbi:uncharacterized protein LOC144165283 isoform X2 [Haemaphysalis longicornis]
MRPWLFALVLFGVCAYLAGAETTSSPKRSKRPLDPNCERASPAESKPTTRAKCRYMCKGWPIRIGFEKDGTFCHRRGKARRPGICVAGKCVNPDTTTLPNGHSDTAKVTAAATP